MPSVRGNYLLRPEARGDPERIYCCSSCEAGDAVSLLRSTQLESISQVYHLSVRNITGAADNEARRNTEYKDYIEP